MVYIIYLVLVHSLIGLSYKHDRTEESHPGNTAVATTLAAGPRCDDMLPPSTFPNPHPSSRSLSPATQPPTSPAASKRLQRESR